MSRRALWAGAVASLLLIILAVFWFRSSDEPSPEEVALPAAGAEELDAPPLSLKFERKPSSWDATIEAKGELVLSGRVLDDSGRPVADAVVTATELHGEDVLSDLDCKCDNACGRKLLECGCPEASGQLVELVGIRTGEAAPLARTRTAADGSFQLSGLRAGEVGLWADAPGVIGFRSPVTVGQSVDVKVSPGRLLHGLVTGSDEKPIAGALVTAIYAQHSRFFDATSGPDGKFTVGPVPLEGTVAVVGMSDGLLPDSAHAREGDEDELRLVLHQPRTLSGVVVKNGEGVAGVTVKLEGEHRKRTATSAEGGRFQFAQLRPGEYQLRALQASAVAHGEAKLLPGEDRSDVTLSLTDGYSVSGTVTDENGRPIAGASVSITRDGRKDWARSTSASDGTYSTEPVMAGDQFIHVSADGYRKAESEKILVSGETRHDLKLKEGATISGRVVDEGGNVIAGARLSAMLDLQDSAPSDFMGPREGAFAMDTAADGGFALKGLLQQKKYVVTAAHDDWTGASVQVSAPARDVTLVMKGGVRVFGVVVDEAGQGVVNASVALTQDEDEDEDTFKGAFMRPKETESGEGGVFELRGVAAGEYSISADPPHELGNWSTESDTSQKLTVGRSAVEVRLVLKEGAALTGRVVDDTQRPVAEARVVARGKGGPDSRGGYATAKSAADGSFKLKGMSGELALTVSAKGFAPKELTVSGGPVVVVLERAGVIVGRVVNARREPVTDFYVNEERIQKADGRFELSDRGMTKTVLVFRAPNLADRGMAVTISGKRTDVGDVSMDEGRVLEGLVRDALTGAPIAGALVDVGSSSFRLAEGDSFLSEKNGAVRTDQQGHFKLPRVSVSADYAIATHPEFLDGQARLTPTDSHLELQMKPGATIEGSALASGKPVQGYVSVLLRHYRMRSSTWIRRDGQFELKGLPAGRYAVMAQSRDGVAFEPLVVEVKAGERRRVTLSPAEGVSVHFEVVDSAGQAVQATLVVIKGGWAGPQDGVLMGAPDQPTFVTSTDGSVKLAPGGYTAIASRKNAGKWEYFSQPITVTTASGEKPLRLQAASWLPVQAPESAFGEEFSFDDFE